MNLSPSQQFKRRISLWFASSYVHPDGTIELDIDEKAGIDPTTDSEEAQRRKFEAWNKRESVRQGRCIYLFVGALAGAAAAYWWLR